MSAVIRFKQLRCASHMQFPTVLVTLLDGTACTVMVWVMVSCLAVLTQSVTACPDSTWKLSPVERCYRALGYNKNLHECVAACSKSGASLPCIRNNADNDFMLHSFDGTFFIGLYQEDHVNPRTGWNQWANGCISNYRNWDSRSEPNDWGGREDCVVLQVSSS